MTSIVVSNTAVCCFCNKPLVRTEGAWWCLTRPCQLAQLEYATFLQDESGKVTQWLYVPTPKQVLWHRAAYDSSLRRILVGGAASPGKSRFLREQHYRFAQQIPGYHGLILRRTHQDLAQSHVRFMPYEVESRGGKWLGGDTRVAKFFHAGQPDAIIRTGHMDDKVAIENYLSAEYDCISPDELVTYERDPMLELFTRARSTSAALCELRGDQSADYDGSLVLTASNPGGRGAGWVKDFFVEKEPDKEEFPDYQPKYWAFFDARVKDNPYISFEGYKETLSNQRAARKRQLLDGDWDVYEGQYFDNFKPKRHLQDRGRLDPALKRFLSLDWGLNSPGCVLFWVCLPDGHYHIEQDYKFNGEVANRLYVRDVAAELKRRCKALGLPKVPTTFVDPDICAHKGQIGQSIAETFMQWGVPAVKADNDRVNGWQRCYEMFRDAPDSEPWLTIDPSCKYLIRTIPLMTADKNNPEDIDHWDDHAADALRYGAMSRTQFSRTKQTAPVVPWSPKWWRDQGKAPESRLLGSESI